MKQLFIALLLVFTTNMSFSQCDLLIEYIPGMPPCSMTVDVGGDEYILNNGNPEVEITVTLPQEICFTSSCGALGTVRVSNAISEAPLYEGDLGDLPICKTFISCDDPLPVELTAFTGSVSNKTIILNWVLASQENLREVYIYRNDEVIDFVGAEDYEYIDESPLVGSNYYSLQFIDYDGSFQWSDKIEVSYTEESIDLIRTIENTYTFKAGADSFNYDVFVYRIDGVLMSNLYWSGQSQDELVISLDNPGMYVVSITDGRDQYSFQVVSK